MVEMETKKPKCPDKDDSNDDNYHMCGAKAPPTSKCLDTDDKSRTVTLQTRIVFRVCHKNKKNDH